jgi:hypothetical protein
MMVENFWLIKFGKSLVIKQFFKNAILSKDFAPK